MSDPDQPFGFGRGERTVFRPNPGGRKPANPQQPAPPVQPSPTPAAYTPATAPAYMPQQGAQPFDPHRGATPNRPAASGGDDWIATGAPARAGGDPHAHMPRAGDLRFDDLAGNHPNPIMRAASPLLLLLGRLRVAVLRASFASLMEQVAEAINFFEKDIRQAGVPAEQANTAKYLLCATADDIVQNIPTEDRHVWTQYSMLSRFFGERIGGVRFFEELDRLLVDPSLNYNVLELQHACLALGFQGVYRTSGGGQATLQQRQRNLYETLRRIRQKVQTDLSPHWQGQALAATRNRFRLPVWVVASVAALSLFGSFVLLRTWLTTRSEAVAGEIHALHPDTRITLQRRLPAPPPRIEPTVAQLTQLQRIRAALKPEIDAGSISVDPEGKWIAIRVGNLILFESGQATVLPQFKPVAQRIASIIEHESGPLQFVGHTDNVPLQATNRFQSNFQLSVERAKAVAALIKPSLSEPGRITTDGKGADKPIAPNTTAEGRAKNRRVEVLVTRLD